MNKGWIGLFLLVLAADARAAGTITEDFEKYTLGDTNGIAWRTVVAGYVATPVNAIYTYADDQTLKVNKGFIVNEPLPVSSGSAEVGSKSLGNMNPPEPGAVNTLAYKNKGNPGLLLTDTATFKFMFNLGPANSPFPASNGDAIGAGMSKQGNGARFEAWAADSLDIQVNSFQILLQGYYGGFDNTPGKTNGLAIGFNPRIQAHPTVYSTNHTIPQILLPLGTRSGFTDGTKGWNPDLPGNTGTSAWNQTWYEIKLEIDGRGTHVANTGSNFGNGVIHIRNASENSKWVAVDFGEVGTNLWGTSIPMQFTADSNLSAYDSFTARGRIDSSTSSCYGAQLDNFSFGATPAPALTHPTGTAAPEGLSMQDPSHSLRTPSKAPRGVNGLPAGEMESQDTTGIYIRSGRSRTLMPWANLSIATRYRLQPGFREQLPDILKGLAPGPASGVSDPPLWPAP